MVSCDLCQAEATRHYVVLEGENPGDPFRPDLGAMLVCDAHGLDAATVLVEVTGACGEAPMPTV